MMPANQRPVCEIKGTSLIRAQDVQGVKNLIRLADRGVDNAIEDNDYEQKMYALGVLEVLRWFDGGDPTEHLAELLNIDVRKENRSG
jgi:hypothetical protein